MLTALFAFALAGEVDDATLAAAKRVKGATVAAWVYGGAAESTPPAGKRYVGAELVLKRYDPRVELSDIEAVNPATKAAYGNPQFACVAADGGWASCAEAGPEVRVRLVWTVSAEAEALKFTLYGRRLAKKAAIDASGPELPRRARAAEGG
ncbi:MAG: hypothetical protein H6737_01880 [Alphaproteobacteria bacterium]|nr:hypothetical protein [Alphaproteobacteria bacterium]